jgi:hypothetical protein
MQPVLERSHGMVLFMAVLGVVSSAPAAPVKVRGRMPSPGAAISLQLAGQIIGLPAVNCAPREFFSLAQLALCLEPKLLIPS